MRIAVGRGPSSVVIGDFDGDGKNDLAVANALSGDVTVLRGDGTGHLKPFPGSPFPGGANAFDMVAADVDGDGKLSLVIANHDEKHVTVLRNDGHGRFATTVLEADVAPHVHGVAVAAFDGRPALALNDKTRGGVLIISGGRSRFVRTGAEPYRNVIAADLNGDGRPDLAVPLRGEHAVAVLFNDGKGGFLPAPGSPFSTGANLPFAVAAGDFDGDGTRDLAVVTYSGNVADASQDGVVVLRGRSFQKAWSGKTGHAPTAIAVGDVNGDGIDDIAVCNEGGADVTVLLGSKNGLREAPGSPFAAGPHPSGVALGDLDGDGHADLAVVLPETNEIRVYFSSVGTAVPAARKAR